MRFALTTPTLATFLGVPWLRYLEKARHPLATLKRQKRPVRPQRTCQLHGSQRPPTYRNRRGSVRLPLRNRLQMLRHMHLFANACLGIGSV